MNRRFAGLALTSALMLLERPACAGVFTFTTFPSDGNVARLPGSTVGWGYATDNLLLGGTAVFLKSRDRGTANDRWCRIVAIPVHPGCPLASAPVAPGPGGSLSHHPGQRSPAGFGLRRVEPSGTGPEPVQHVVVRRQSGRQGRPSRGLWHGVTGPESASQHTAAQRLDEQWPTVHRS
jgi:hypothetical protein